VSAALDAALARLGDFLASLPPEPPPPELSCCARPELRERVARGELTWADVWARPEAVDGGVALVRAALRRQADEGPLV